MTVIAYAIQWFAAYVAIPLGTVGLIALAFTFPLWRDR